MFDSVMLKYRDLITNHMNFLGYNFQNLKQDDIYVVDLFKHSSKNSIFLEYRNDFIVMKVFSGTEDAKIDLNKVSDLNSEKVIKISYNINLKAMRFMFFINHYDKNNF